ncbi:MOSC N-terminal beta barrel domain-containing protein [Noviherbaspirillum sp. CPCC 100848]|uniref:MOSC N-terminal beta barrel domain-containing protein n=1 Tax=Noviherbaspirillum album TaxID=3080276 RepID=A0ABU6J6P1_9BURK|nr:MOSC N-terminal beta barrel domain-containing protein [Noviherbaspirillum sp. CPCC 100848]MEC4719103.1 MOSC N-terminal beta barrel domain-containing protein [Noviherbaspirillum sp. CPCC 100848]
MPILTELNLYPVKSCAAVSLREATLTAAGLMSEHIYDREWMVVDAQGHYMTQRDFPRMALITPRIKADTLELRAPGMLRLEVPLGLPDPEDEKTLTVTIWDESLQAYDCDEVTATWFSKFLGVPCRLVRFHAEAKRLASAKWTAGVEAPTLFSDGYPVLLISQASLDDLNGKLQAQGRSALPMNRFRPNIVIGGVEAFDEDVAESLTIGEAVLKPVKPCARCPMPSIDQATGEFGPDPIDILRTYRANPRLDGGISFGMNAILLKGEGQLLKIGQDIDLTLAF